MPRIPGGSRGYAAAPGGGTISPGNPSNLQRFSTPTSSVRRHQFQSGATYPGAGVLITQQVYAYIELLKFERTFTAAADTPDTPIANTSNYPTPKVFNGSKIQNFSANILLRNETPNTPVYLDVYMDTLSFYDALVWNTIYSAACPVGSGNFTLGSINGGEVTMKAPVVGLVDDQTINDSKFLQHYIKPIGTIVVPPIDSGGVAEVNLTMIPDKCRRSQTGMHWAIYFANDALKNQGDKSVRITADINFDEIPSSAREVNFPG